MLWHYVIFVESFQNITAKFSTSIYCMSSTMTVELCNYWDNNLPISFSNFVKIIVNLQNSMFINLKSILHFSVLILFSFPHGNIMVYSPHLLLPIWALTCMTSLFHTCCNGFNNIGTAIYITICCVQTFMDTLLYILSCYDTFQHTKVVPYLVMNSSLIILYCWISEGSK